MTNSLYARHFIEEGYKFYILVAHLAAPVSYTHLDVYKRQVNNGHVIHT